MDIGSWFLDIVLVAVLQRCGTLEVLGSRNVSQITLHCGDFFPCNSFYT